STPTATGTLGPTATATATATPVVICTPRPPVSVVAVANGDGRLRVTVSASGAGNTLASLTFATSAQTTGNGQIDAPAPANPVLSAANPPATITLPGGTTSYQFFIRRATPGQPVTVPFSVEDRCGSWSTFA